MLLKVCKFNKYLDIFNANRDLLILSKFNFFTVYTDIFSRND